MLGVLAFEERVAHDSDILFTLGYSTGDSCRTVHGSVPSDWNLSEYLVSVLGIWRVVLGEAFDSGSGTFSSSAETGERSDVVSNEVAVVRLDVGAGVSSRVVSR